MLRRQKLTKKNCRLETIYVKEGSWHIQISTPAWANAHLRLQFVERYTTRMIEHSVSAITQKRREASLAKTDLHQLLEEGKDWDVFVIDGSSERIRLTSSLQEFEELFFLKDGKMLSPFVTFKGNLSFKSQEPYLTGSIKEMKISNKTSLELKGTVFHPLWDREPANLAGSMVFSSKNGSNEAKVPVVFTGRTYQCSIPIDLLVFPEDDLTMNAKISISYSNAGTALIDETPPLKLASPQFQKLSLIRNITGIKKAIKIDRTKKAKQLTIRIYTYDFNKETKATIRSSLISIKRHSIVKTLFIKAFKWIGMLPVNKRIIVFESFLGKQFSDNPRAIYEYLLNGDRDYTMYWSVDKNYLHNFHDKNLVCIRRFSLKWLLTLPRARYWITNSRMPVWLPKPKHTTYLQTWHGTPLKRLAADMDEVYMPGTTAESYKKNFIKEASNWDLLVSPNAYSTEIFRRAFQFKKEVLETGYPRNDFLFNNDDLVTLDALKKRYGLPLDKKIILYAPTWRDNQFHSKGKYSFDIEMDLELLKRELADDYVIVFRLHYLVSENLDLSSSGGFVYDFSNHEDIRELYLLADLLITDYSSVFFDYANLKRPMIFYVYDIEEYRDNLRGFYFDFEEEAPGPLVKTNEELVATIKQIEADGFQLSPKFKEFHDKFCYLEDGNSTRKVVERVFHKKTNLME